MSESRTRAATNGEESHQRKAEGKSLFDTKRRGDSRPGRILGRVFSRDGKSARLVSVDCVFSF
jgi:hypothetical protein